MGRGPALLPMNAMQEGTVWKESDQQSTGL